MGWGAADFLMAGAYRAKMTGESLETRFPASSRSVPRLQQCANEAAQGRQIVVADRHHAAELHGEEAETQRPARPTHATAQLPPKLFAHRSPYLRHANPRPTAGGA